MSDNTVPPVEPAADDDGDNVVNNTELQSSSVDPATVDHTLPGSPVAEPDHAPVDVDAPDMGMEKARNEANPTHDPVLRDEQERAAARVGSDATHTEGDPTLAGDSIQTPASTDPQTPGARPAPDNFRAKYTRNLNGTVDAAYWPAGSNNGKSLGNFADMILAKRAVQDAVATEYHRDRVVSQEQRVQEEAQARLDDELSRKEEAYSVDIEEIDEVPAL